MLYHETRATMESKHQQRTPLPQLTATTAEPWKEHPEEHETRNRRRHILIFAYFAAFSYSLLINRSRLQAHSSVGLSIYGPRKGIIQRPAICDALVQHSPFQQWINQLERIRKASRLAFDHDFVLENVTNTVLLRVTELLPHSLKTIPTEDLSTLAQTIERRLRYLQHPYLFGAEPPLVTITVLGGSVTAGVQCNTGIPAIRNERCAWPTRLEQFVNNFVKLTLNEHQPGTVPDLIQVHTLAVGGTNTATGRAILEFDVLPPEASQPDILINAYSTNDMHVLTMQEALASNVTIRDLVFAMHQDFIRTALQCPHSRPVLFWLDDYIGNEQREILATQELAQSMHVLSSYYGFGYVSYADAVRSLVYGDTKETTFSPEGWYTGSGSRMKREIHPGQGMHMSVAWMMAFSIFSSISTHCTRSELLLNMNKLKVPGPELPPDRRDKLVNGKTLQKHLENAVPAAPQQRPFGLPPRLTTDLDLDSVSQLWQRDSRRIGSDCLASSTLRCPVSWVSGIPWREEKWLENFFQPLLSERNPGWSLLDDSNGRGKIGWIPRNDTFITASGHPELRFVLNDEDHRASNIQTVTLFYMKSYGPRWESSEATVQLRHQRHGGRWQVAGAPVVLSGIHNKTTSEMYTETISVVQSATGGPATALQVELIHTGGSTFKLMGLAVCQ